MNRSHPGDVACLIIHLYGEHAVLRMFGICVSGITDKGSFYGFGERAGLITVPRQ